MGTPESKLQEIRVALYDGWYAGGNDSNDDVVYLLNELESTRYDCRSLHDTRNSLVRKNETLQQQVIQAIKVLEWYARTGVHGFELDKGEYAREVLAIIRGNLIK